MTAKQYLSQLSRLENRIQFRLDEIKRLQDMATSIASSQGDGMNVQRTRNFDKMGDAVAKIVDIKNKYADQVNLYEIKRQKIVSQIEDIDDDKYYSILMGFYIQHKSMSDIAETLDRSMDRMRKLHEEALDEFDRLYKSTYNQK